MSGHEDARQPPRKRFGACAIALVAAALGLLGVESSVVMFDHMTPAFENGVSIGLIASFILCWLALRARLDGPRDQRTVATIAVVVALLDVLPWVWTRLWLMVGHGIGMPH